MPSTTVSEELYPTGSTIYLLLVTDSVFWKTSFENKTEQKTGKRKQDQMRNLPTIRNPVAELETIILGSLFEIQ